MSSKEKKAIMKYTQELLDLYINRDGATLKTNDKKLKRDDEILFMCKCGKDGKKNFRLIVETSGAFCKNCTNINKQLKTKSTNIAIFGVDNPMKNKAIKAKADETIADTYGVSNISQLPEIKEKKIETCLQHYNVEHPAQSPIIQDKMKATNQLLRNVDYPMQSHEVQEKSIETNQKNRGTDYPMQCQKVKEKSEATSINIWGVPYANQNPEHLEKTQTTCKQIKCYKMPSGEIRKVQGYEPFALNDLLKDGMTEEQVITGVKNVPSIEYIINNKIRKHFPDIHIPHLNKLIEIKSKWTYSCKEDNIQLKKKTAEQKGYIYEIWIYDRKGNRIEIL